MSAKKYIAFAPIFERAVNRKGGEDAVLGLSHVDLRSKSQLCAVDDSRYLAEMTKAVFKAGFVWNVIDKKWPDFEEAFWKFNVLRCAMMSPDDVHALSQDERIVRNLQKINTVPLNAVMVLDGAKSHGSFGKLVAEWPEENYVDLLAYLKKHGARLGGNSAQYFLRVMGKDGFVLSKDNILALVEAGIIDSGSPGKKAMGQIQEVFNQWQQETGFSLARLSRILAMSSGDNVLR